MISQRIRGNILFFAVCVLVGDLIFDSCAFFAGAADDALVLRRLNSPERQAAIEDMAGKDAAQRAAGGYAATGGPAASGNGGNAPVSPPFADNTLPPAPYSEGLRDALRGTGTASLPAGSSSIPRPLSHMLIEQAASFLGVPAPMRAGMDEGAGFHQDGAARRAGGPGNAGPSDGGMRAAAYARSGLGYGYGSGDVPLSGIGYDHLTGRYDPARDGRRSRERNFDAFDPLPTAQDRALSWGMGALNAAGESAVSGLVDNGRARLNFTLDRDGNFRGEGDVLLPFHDSQYTTIFTQLGARSMAVSGGEDDGNDRWIGNFGLGQRWFPNAAEEDSGNWMLGYNAFFDNDFTRSHRRAGVGLEAQYDWLHMASNYYFQLSGWKGSYDFDSRFIEERPAEGWDARLKAYLPFYRNVALSGAYSQWFGDHVGMFGHRNPEKDPKVWSYGVEYTPVPLLSGFVNQRSTERGKTDTEFGLNVTYHFGMPWDEQIQHSKVAELRTVSGSRHEFVDRENRIILEYRATDAYRIEYLGPAGSNPFRFRFRVLNGFDEVIAGQTVYVTASPPCLSAPSYPTDGRGEFVIELVGAPGPVTVTIQAGKNEQTFTLDGSVSSLISMTAFTNGGNFTTGDLYATASLTAKVVDTSGSPVSGAKVTWTVETARNNSKAMMSGWESKKTGLTWGYLPELGLDYNTLAQERIVSATNNTSDTGPDGETTMQLTDIVGERIITVRSEVTITGTTYSATQDVSFGNGPLSVFNAPVGTSSPYLTWYEAYQACNGSAYTGNPSDWSSGEDVGGGKMPTIAVYQAVSPRSNPNPEAQGAASAAGWPGEWPREFYWTGEAQSGGAAAYVRLRDGTDSGQSVNGTNAVACRR
jgi:hypothetical protein